MTEDTVTSVRQPRPVYLTETDILGMHNENLRTWQPRTQMWPFTYGAGAIGASAGLTGLLVNYHYRNKFYLKKFARLSSFAPSVVLPCVTAIGLHQMFVTSPMLLKRLECPLCSEARAAQIQLGTGLVQPFVIGLAAALFSARMSYSISMPGLTDFKGFGRFMAEQTTGRFRSMLLIATVMNIATAIVITQAEQKTCNLMWEKLLQTGVVEHTRSV